MNLSNTEAEALCNLRQCSRGEVAIINDMLKGVLSKHESADLRLEIRELKAAVIELSHANKGLYKELELERNRKAD